MAESWGEVTGIGEGGEREGLAGFDFSALFSF